MICVYVLPDSLYSNGACLYAHNSVMKVHYSGSMSWLPEWYACLSVIKPQIVQYDVAASDSCFANMGSALVRICTLTIPIRSGAFSVGTL